MIPRLTLITLLVLAGCTESEEIDEPAVYDNRAEVEAYYRANPERFVFSAIDQLPVNLDWQDGVGLPEVGDPDAQRGAQLRIRLNSMQQTLRVVGPDANATLRGPLWSANMVSLLMRHPWSDAYMPGVARRWAIDPSGSRKIYLELDPDARWSDGRPFTADDVLFSLYFLLSPHIQDPAINRVYDDNITSVTRYDDYTVAIEPTNPSPDPLSGMTTYMLHQREFYREFGEDYVERYHWRFAPVTGAYRLDKNKVRKGRQVTFDRIENWWANDKPYYRHRFNPDRLTFMLIRDDNKAFDSFLKGDIDWHFLDRTQLWYENAGEDSIANGYVERAWVYNQLPAARIGIYMNAMHSLLEDPNVRAGLQHAVNYDNVNEKLYRGDRRRIRSFADGYGAYSHPELRARQFDPDLAEKYFAEAGFGSRDDDGVLINTEGERLSLVLTVNNRGDDVTLATLLKEQARTTGLELIIDVLDPTAYFTKIFEKNFQLSLHGWHTGYSVLPAFEWELRGIDAGKPGNFNTTNIRDETLDDLLVEWDSNSDPEKAIQLSHAAQERVHAFGAWVPGLTADFRRIGYWRWVRWPGYFQVPRYFSWLESGVFWVDEQLREETLKARKEGRPFPPVTRVYDHWRPDQQ